MEGSKALSRLHQEGKALCLYASLCSISAMLGNPVLVFCFLRELTKLCLEVKELALSEEIIAAELASKVGLDFDDGLHYYLARKLWAAIVSFDKDFDGLDIETGA